LNLTSKVAPTPSPSDTHIILGASLNLFEKAASHSNPGINELALQESNPGPDNSLAKTSVPPQEICSLASGSSLKKTIN